MTALTTEFAAALHADGPAEDRAEKLALYAWLIGDWDADVISCSPDDGRHNGRAELHFGWVLEGRAIQDIWMIPRRKDRASMSSTMPIAGNWYGTTLRIYDPDKDAWRIYWIDPATNSFRYQIGRQRGQDIVQEGTTESGALSRWTFTDIRSDTFRWLGESSSDGGKTWRLVVEVKARRTP